jgi:hypothetical protein
MLKIMSKHQHPAFASNNLHQSLKNQSKQKYLQQQCFLVSLKHNNQGYQQTRTQNRHRHMLLTNLQV